MFIDLMRIRVADMLGNILNMKQTLLQLVALIPFVGYFVYSYTQADPIWC